jgi:PAS domain S-box-containing protein
MSFRSSRQPRIIRNLAASWLGLPISYRGIIVIALPTICTLATLVAWVWTRQEGQKLVQRIEDVYIQTRASEDVLSTLLNAETGVRGYALTREDRFLEPYHVARQRLPETLKNLSEAQQNALKKGDLISIEQRVQQRIKNLELQIQLAQVSSPNSIRTNQLLDRGKALMDGLRQDIGTLRRLQDQNLAADQATLTRLRKTIKFIQQLMAVAGILSFLGAIYLFRRLENELGDRERQLLQSKTLIESLTSNMVDGVLTLSQHGKVETINPAVTRLFQYQAIDLLGQHVTKLWFNPTNRAKKVSPPFMEELLLGHSWQTLAFRQDGSVFPVELSISETRSKKQFIVLVRDLTEQVATEAQLKAQADQLAKLNLSLIQSNAELERQNQELETFTYVAAHDLKTPLRGISTLSEWIEDDLGPNLPPSSQEQLKLLRSRVLRLTTLINELLDYSRIGRNKSAIERVAVEDLLRKVIDALPPPDNIAIAIGPGMPTFETDKDLLQKVFFQLIENSILHHDLSEGHIAITVQEHAKEYEFIVSDDGPGIPPEFHQRVFTAFQILERRNDEEQAGIGLAMVKKIVELGGGMVWLATEGDRGLAVHFTWAKDISRQTLHSRRS